ncbi:hypothetical protein [Nostoc sp. MG11]|uniref:hypothetical protein n=1 Tax=Nostoc sp. MG11 TaxID=2721166 RepID=UPI0018680841|nr:hypothetical protein [Nostoc sp. MG11]
MKRSLKFLTSFTGVVITTVFFVLFLTFIPNISNFKLSNWVNSASLNNFEAIEQSSEYISVLDNRSGLSLTLPQNESFSVGLRIPPGVGRAITRWLKSVAEEPGFIRLLLSLFLPLINIIIGLLIFLINILLGFFNLISFVLLPIWLYLVNLIRSKWEQVHMDLHLKITSEEEAKRRFPLQKKQNISKVLIKNYKGFLNKLPIQIYKEETCVVRIDLSCKPQQDTKNQAKKRQSDSSFLDAFYNIFEPQISESSFSEKIQLDKKEDYSLELDLSSPEFKILPSEKQSQSLDLEKLSYRWNCKANNTGEHKLDLVFRVVEQSDSSKIQKIVEMERDVRVVQIFGLTKDQAENFAKGVAAVAVTYGLIKGIMSGLRAVF